MVQRHEHDDTVTLEPGHANPTSALYVPIPLRAAFDAIDADTEEKLKRDLYTTISEPWVRTINGRHHVINHRTVESDFDIGLTWLKVDAAARRVQRDNERRTDQERSQRTHTCRLCGRFDRTADNTGTVRSGTGVWCQRCRDELRRQEVADHAALEVNGRTVAELVADARRQVAAP